MKIKLLCLILLVAFSAAFAADKNTEKVTKSMQKRFFECVKECQKAQKDQNACNTDIDAMEEGMRAVMDESKAGAVSKNSESVKKVSAQMSKTCLKSAKAFQKDIK